MREERSLSVSPTIWVALALLCWTGNGCAARQAPPCAGCAPGVLRSTGADAQRDPAGRASVAVQESLSRLAAYLDHTALDEPHALIFLDVVRRSSVCVPRLKSWQKGRFFAES